MQTILFIDQDLHFVQITKDNLNLHLGTGMIYHSQSIEEALEIIEQEIIDIIITDIKIKSTEKDSLVNPIQFLFDFRESHKHEDFKIILHDVEDMYKVENLELVDGTLLRPASPEKIKELILKIANTKATI